VRSIRAGGPTNKGERHGTDCPRHVGADIFRPPRPASRTGQTYW